MQREELRREGREKWKGKEGRTLSHSPTLFFLSLYHNMCPCARMGCGFAGIMFKKSLDFVAARQSDTVEDNYYSYLKQISSQDVFLHHNDKS